MLMLLVLGHQNVATVLVNLERTPTVLLLEWTVVHQTVSSVCSL